MWTRRVIASLVDLAAAQFVASAALNLVGWPLPVWVAPLVLPLAFTTLTAGFGAIGREARTPGQRAAGLVTRCTDGARPGFASRLVRSGTLAVLLLTDWGDVVTGASRTAATFGGVLLAVIAGCTLVLAQAATAQWRTGASTPWDAAAGTCVERAGTEPATHEPAPLARDPVPAILTSTLVAALFVFQLVQSMANDCRACRAAEAGIASRYGALARVFAEAPAERVNGRERTTIGTRVWLPLCVSPRREREDILRVAVDMVEREARARNMRADRRTSTLQLEQWPFQLMLVRDLAGVQEPYFRFGVVPGGTVGFLHLEYGFFVEFTAVPDSSGGS